MLRFCKRLLAALAAAALMTLGALAEPAALTVTESTRRDDGVLRVLLRSMKGEQTLHLTLAGSYTVEGDRRPSALTAAPAATLSIDGRRERGSSARAASRIGMGESLTLTRQAVTDGGENGLYIAESETGTRFTMGDLTVSARGRRRCGLHARPSAMEDYLHGRGGLRDERFLPAGGARRRRPWPRAPTPCGARPLRRAGTGT